MPGAIVNAVIVTMDPARRVLKDAGILWDGGKIAMLGDTADILMEAKKRKIPLTDAKGAVVFPGLINTHNHLFQHLLKGLGTDLNLEAWWPTVIGPTGIQLRECHLRSAVKAGALEALRSGTTTIVDYMQVHPVPGLSDVEIETAMEIGIRLVYGRGFRNYAKSGTFPKELIEDLDKVFREVEDLNRRYTDHANHMVHCYLAPAAAWAVTFDGLKETVEFAKNQQIPITMHVFETNTDNEVCLDRYGMRAIEYYEKAGLLSPSFLALHCVRMDSTDIQRFAANDVKISHNPLSNMYLASGVAPVPEFRRCGLTVSLGCDGAASNNSNNMLEVLKATALLHKVHSGDPEAICAMDVLEMATLGGARAIGLENEIGSLEVGKRADLFLFDPLRSPTCCPMHDPVASLVYSSDTRGIIMTVVNGKTLLKNDQFCGLDEAAVLWEEQKQAQNLIELTDFISACR